MRKFIEITIMPDSQVTIEAHGYAGQTCLDATKDFEALIGKEKRRWLKAPKQIDRVHLGRKT